MLAKTFSGVVMGAQGVLVNVEVDVSKAQLPVYRTVGLAGAEVREAKERVSSALRNSGHRFPDGRVTVSLAPADLRKQGTAFDLSVALSIVCATGFAAAREKLRTLLVLGELALDGEVRAIRGALPIALAAARGGIRTAIVPAERAKEADLVEGIRVVPVTSLAEAIEWLNGNVQLAVHGAPAVMLELGGSDFADVKGQYRAKRAMEIAAAGAHNLLMVGPPGAGKTMMARACASILPPLSKADAIEVACVESAAGLGAKTLNRRPPFRAPHHSISFAAMAGGGSTVRPGEVSLSHAGVLFLDEFAEFPRRVLEVLRQPLEQGTIAISRVRERVEFPARFILMAAMNPCPCGFLDSESRNCSCSSSQIQRYRSKLSGPLMDRLDLLVPVRALSADEIFSKPTGESSRSIRERVIAARQRQVARLEAFRSAGAPTNGSMSPAAIENTCQLVDESRTLAESVVRRLKLSTRGYHRLLRVARTIADLEGVEGIHLPMLQEAVQFRFSGFFGEL